MKRLLFVALFTMTLLLPTGTAHAASSYDQVIKGGGNALVSVANTTGGGVCAQGGPYAADLSASWTSILADSDRYHSAYASQEPAVSAAFNSVHSAGKGWALMQYTTQGNRNWPSGGAASAYGNGDRYLALYFSDNSTAQLVSAYGSNELQMSGSWYVVYFAYTSIDNHCVPGISEVVHGSGPSLYWLEQQGYQSPEERAVFINFDITYPEGYEGPVVRTTMPPAAYVAMGDSFSSGEGNPPFEAGSDTSSDKCHRSTKAYPWLLELDNSLDLGRMAFVACSGATTDNVLNGQNGEPPQIDALTADTKVVTITVGGNDVGFGDYVTHCVTDGATGCGPGTGSYQTIVDKINSQAFLESLENTYETVLSNAPSAKVYVPDYPYLFGNQGSYLNCTLADASGAYSVESLLNSTIALAIANVRSENSDFRNRLVYVNVNLPSSPFADEFLCTDDTSGTAFNPVYLPPLHKEYGLHPNVLGHQNFAQTLEGSGIGQ